MPSRSANRSLPGAARPVKGVNRSALGTAAENRAAAALTAAGYRIVERNVRFRRGELDLVAWHRDVLVFVEVRSRASNRFGAASFAIPIAKQRQVGRLAQLYLATRRLSPAPQRCRFDVVAITGEDLVIFADAFRL